MLRCVVQCNGIGLEWHGMQCDVMLCYGMVWYGNANVMLWYGMVWNAMLW